MDLIVHACSAETSVQLTANRVAISEIPLVGIIDTLLECDLCPPAHLGKAADIHEFAHCAVRFGRICRNHTFKSGDAGNQLSEFQDRDVGAAPNVDMT